MNDFKNFMSLLNSIHSVCGSLLNFVLFDEDHSDFMDEVSIKFETAEAAVAFYLLFHHRLECACSLYLNSNVIRVLFSHC